jgi:hypothetical protein
MVVTYNVYGVALIQMPTQKFTPEIINAAILGFEEQKRHIDAQIAELRTMLDGGRTEPAATPETPTLKRRKFSAAARQRMKEAQQLRWGKIKGESEPPSEQVTMQAAKPKRKLSKAGRAAIVAALKKRWAAKKAAAAKPKPATQKKTAAKTAVAKRKLSPAGKAALVANLAKARAAKAAKATAGAQ